MELSAIVSRTITGPVDFDSEHGPAILQVGFDAVQSKPFNVDYNPWVEWFPEYSIYYSLELKAGDTVRMTVRVSGPSSGFGMIENLSTGQSANTTFNTSNTNGTLCRETAEWIVEVRLYGPSR